MARITYDIDQPVHNNSAGHYRPRFDNSYALLAIVILLVLFFWNDLPRLRSNLGSWLRDNPNSMTTSVQGSTVRPITEMRYVTGDNLNLREQPSKGAQARYTLPRGTKVALLGETHRELDGDVWLKVRVETLEGTYVGWVSQHYVE
jgi:hypothetical protein